MSFIRFSFIVNMLISLYTAYYVFFKLNQPLQRELNDLVIIKKTVFDICLKYASSFKDSTKFSNTFPILDSFTPTQFEFEYPKIKSRAYRAMVMSGWIDKIIIDKSDPEIVILKWHPSEKFHDMILSDYQNCIDTLGLNKEKFKRTLSKEIIKLNI